MSVYERTFGTDWDALDRASVLRRAFALGVAESLGEPGPDGELDRLRSQVTGRYERSIVDLAYDEGRTRGKKARRGRDAATVWSSLVEDDAVAPGTSARPSAGTRPARRTDLPPSISTPAFLSFVGDDLSRLDLPDFLRK